MRKTVYRLDGWLGGLVSLLDGPVSPSPRVRWRGASPESGSESSAGSPANARSAPRIQARPKQPARESDLGETAPKRTPTQRTAAKKATAKKATAKKAVPPKIATKKAATPKPATQKPATKSATPAETAPKKATVEKPTSGPLDAERKAGPATAAPNTVDGAATAELDLGAAIHRALAEAGDEGISMTELGRRLGVGRGALRPRLRALIDGGNAERVGAGLATRYRIRAGR